MKKEGISTKIIGIIAVILLIGAVSTFFIIYKNFGFSQDDGEVLPEEINDSANQTSEEERQVTSCSGYLDQENCESDSHAFGNCVWDVNV